MAGNLSGCLSFLYYLIGSNLKSKMLPLDMTIFMFRSRMYVRLCIESAEWMKYNKCEIAIEFVKLAPMVREISWSNNVVIMEKCKDDLQREFYIQMTKRYGWTKRVLTNFVEAQTYEKYLLNQTNFDLTLPAERRVQAKLAVKDEYTFDFAELSPEYSEHELEMQLVNNVRAFLIEMGGDFTFIGNQYHMVVGSRDLYIDLLLFHRRIRSLVAIELKIGEFEAEYAGKMQLYLTALDEQVKLPDENPSIGIIICKSKDKT